MKKYQVSVNINESMEIEADSEDEAREKFAEWLSNALANVKYSVTKI